MVSAETRQITGGATLITAETRQITGGAKRGLDGDLHGWVVAEGSGQ